MDKKKIQKVVREYILSGCGEMYVNAPSEACKAYLEHTFAAELYEADEYKRIRAELEKDLNKKDWEYLAKVNKNGPRKAYFLKMASE